MVIRQCQGDAMVILGGFDQVFVTEVVLMVLVVGAVG